jgi:hypothetical protein
MFASCTIIPAAGSWMEWRPVFLFLASLTTLLIRHKNPILDTLACPFITSALRNLVGNLARARRIAPRDWSCLEGCKKRCGCEACRSVRTFLINPTQQIGRFKYATKTRNHIQHTVLDNAIYKFETEKRGSPNTLVAYKTTNGFHTDMAEWNLEVSEMQRQLFGMRNDYLTNLMGTDIEQVAGLENAVQNGDGVHGVGVGTTGLLQSSSTLAQNGAHLRLSYTPEGHK